MKSNDSISSSRRKVEWHQQRDKPGWTGLGGAAHGMKVCENDGKKWGQIWKGKTVMLNSGDTCFDNGANR